MPEQRIMNVADIPLTDNAAAGTSVHDNELPTSSAGDVIMATQHKFKPAAELARRNG
jgi:hypothetical protein